MTVGIQPSVVVAMAHNRKRDHLYKSATAIVVHAFIDGEDNTSSGRQFHKLVTWKEKN